MNFCKGKKKDFIMSIIGFIILLSIGLSMMFAPFISSENIAEKYGNRLNKKIFREKEKEEEKYDTSSKYDSLDSYNNYLDKKEETISEDEIKIQRDINDIKESEDNITLKTEITMFLKYVKYANDVDGDYVTAYNIDWTITCIILILAGGCIVASLICCIVQIFFWIFSKYSCGKSCVMLKVVFVFWILATLFICIQYSFYAICQTIGLVYLLSGIAAFLFFMAVALWNIINDLKQSDNRYKEITNQFTIIIMMILSILCFTNISGNMIGMDANLSTEIETAFVSVNGSSMLFMGIEGKEQSKYDEETQLIISQKKQKGNEEEISKEYKKKKKNYEKIIVCGIFLFGIMLISLLLFLINSSSKLTKVHLVLNLLYAALNIGLFILFHRKLIDINDYLRKNDLFELTSGVMIYSGIFLNVCIIIINIWKLKVNRVIQKKLVTEPMNDTVTE